MKRTVEVIVRIELVISVKVSSTTCLVLYDVVLGLASGSGSRSKRFDIRIAVFL